MAQTISVVEYARKNKDFFTHETYILLQELCMQEEYKDIISCYNNSIRFGSYAGVIQLKNGVFIEVLPKTHAGKEEDGRNVFIKMLKKLKSTYYKSFSDMNISTSDFPILEVFITIFLNELDELIKIGIKKNYVKVQENSGFVRGKIKIKENIKYNHSHKERVYIEYGKLIENIPENMIVKTCVEYLFTKTQSAENKKRLNFALTMFEDVFITYTPENLLRKIYINRLNAYYEPVLEIAKVFLLGSSFLPKAGSNKMISLLFPLNRLFEDYVFKYLQETYKSRYKSIKAQSNPYYLIDSKNKFRLKPDIVMEDDEKIVILDTKWKLLDSSAMDGKSGVSQSDLYQLYAYGKKYQSKTNKKIELVLIYPKTERFSNSNSDTWYFEEGDDSLPISIVPFDLEPLNGNECELLFNLYNS